MCKARWSPTARSAQPITLTGVVASPGSWGGISAIGTVIAPAHVNLNYVTLDYGGVSGSSGAQVYADQAVVSITHSLIRNSAGNGVYTTLNTPLDAHATNFVGNGQNAIQLNQPSTDLLMTDLTASGNGTDGVRLAGSSVLHGQKRWTFPGIPYIVDGPVRTDLGDVLTIDPGNTLQFTSLGWLYIRGRLNALGTASKPITLTGQTQTAGAWIGLFIDGGVHQAVAQLDYVTIEYAGSDINGANIEVANGRLIVAPQHHPQQFDRWRTLRQQLGRLHFGKPDRKQRSLWRAQSDAGARRAGDQQLVGRCRRASIGCGWLQHGSRRQSNGGSVFFARAHRSQRDLAISAKQCADHDPDAAPLVCARR